MKFILFLLALCFSAFSIAQPCDPITAFQVNGFGSGTGRTAAEACATMNTTSNTWIAFDNLTCVSGIQYSNGQWQYYRNVNQIAVCPQGGPVINGKCECDPCKDKKGQTLGTKSIWAVVDSDPGNYGGNVCLDNCVHSTGGAVCAPVIKSPGDSVTLQMACEVQGPFTNQGYQCSSGAPRVKQPYADPPKPYYDNGKGIADCASSGGAWGHINGVDTCVKGSGAGQGDGKGTGLSGGVNGSTTDKTTENKTNPDGSTTKMDTETTTSCKDGVCVITVKTTQTTTDNAGNTGTPNSGSNSKSQDQVDYCKSNPNSNLCFKSDFSGNCASNFVCSGDAVQCATAKGIWQQNCSSQWLTTPGNPSASTAQVDSKTVDVNKFESLQMSDSGQCPSDKTYTVAGQTFTLSLDYFCNYLMSIRYVVIAFGWLVAAYIVFSKDSK